MCHVIGVMEKAVTGSVINAQKKKGTLKNEGLQAQKPNSNAGRAGLPQMRRNTTRPGQSLAHNFKRTNMDEKAELATGAYSRMANFSTLMRKYQLADFDCIVAITGSKGIGKSSWGINFMRKYLSMHFGSDYFSVKKHVAYDNEEVKKMLDLPKYSPFMADEATRFAMGEDWMRADNKELKKILAQCRTPKNLIALLNIPMLTWLDSKYRGGLVNMWVWIPVRGIALYFTPDRNPGVDDPWHLKFFQKKIGFIDEFTDFETLLRKVRKHPCYKDYMTFPKVPAKIYAKYHEYRTERTEGEFLRSARTQKELANIAALNFYYRYDEILAAINDTRMNRPTWRLMSDQLFRDPRTGKGTINFSYLRKATNDLAKKHGLDLQIIPEEEPLEEQLAEVIIDS